MQKSASARCSDSADEALICSGDVVAYPCPTAPSQMPVRHHLRKKGSEVLRAVNPLRQLLQVCEKWQHRLMSKKILTAMKLTAFLLILTLHVCAKSSSQTITFSGKDVSLGKLFNEIKRQTGYGVFGNASLLKQTRKVSVAAVNMPLNNFLQIVFKDQPVTYRLLDKTIILYKRDAPLINPAYVSSNNDVDAQRETAAEDPVKGRVLGEDGKPLLGVSIRIKGGTTGVSTDEQGNFTIPVKAKQTLIISYIGMETQELKISDPSKPVKIILKPSDAAMKDIVVTGYSNLRKESFTGNAVKVEKEQILKVAQRNVIDVLQVFDPSFRIEMNNLRGSDPNNLPNFYVRGRSGIGVKALDASDLSKASLQNNPNLPVFIMDGYEVTTERVYDLDPTRIKSITILKDAAATAIYGSRAANGVVVIESVAPIAGKLRVNYNFVSSFTAPDLSDYNLMNASEKLEAEKLAGFYESTDPNLQSELTNEYLRKQNQVVKGVNTDWISQPVTNQFNQKHTVAVDGGSNEFRFTLLLKYDHQNGVMKKSKRERTGAGLAVEYRVNNFQFRNDVSYDVVKATNSPYGNFADYTWKAPYEEMKDRDGQYTRYTVVPVWHGGGNSNELNDINPLYEVFNTKNSSTNGYHALINNFSVNWRVLPHLQIKGQLAINKTTDDLDEFYDPASARFKDTGDQARKGTLLQTRGERLMINTNLFANYINSINRHNMNFSAGINTNEVKSFENTMYYSGFPSGSQSSPNFAAKRERRPEFADNHTRMFGAFLALNYSFNDIYLLDVSSRLDGSSEFGSEKRFAPFWSLGTGVNLHKYDFMRNYSFISRARITGSFGQLGKTNFQPFEARDNYQIVPGWYKTGVGANLMYLGNPSLTWEKTNTYDLIFDMGFFKDRINLNVNWYNKVTIDLVNDVDLPLSSGFRAYKENIGKIRNRGFEVFLRADVVRSKDFLVAVYANLATNKNTLVNLSRSLQNYNQKVDSQYVDYDQHSKDLDKKGRYSTPHTKYIEGGSLTSIFGMRSLGINPMDGKEVFLTKDGTVTYDWNAADQVIIGDRTPKGQGAFGVNISYKGFTLFTSCLYQYGSQEYNTTLLNKVENVDLYNRNTDRRVLTDRWRKPGDITKLKDIRESLMTTRPTSRFIQDYNAITINSLSLGYNVNQEYLKKFGLSMCRVQVSTNNLATISTVRQERGLEYPFARTFDLSLNLGF